MKEYLGIIVLLMIVALRFFPVIFSCYLVFDTKIKKCDFRKSRGVAKGKADTKNAAAFAEYKAGMKRMALFVLSTLGIQGVLYFAFHYYHRGYANFLYTAELVSRLEIEYSYGMYLSLSLLAAFIAAFLTGITGRGRRPLDSTKRNVAYLVSALAGILVLGGFGFSEMEKEQLVINEVCSNNTNVYILENDAYCDYVELYNKGDFICQLDDLYLSDDGLNLKKVQIEETLLYPGEYLVVGLDKEQTDFSLDQKGEELYLSDSYGNIWDQVNTGEQAEDTAYTRLQDGEEEWAFRSCTPGTSNQESGSLAEVEIPQLSHPGGFYEEEFLLTLQAKADHKIYYTVDGSIPDEDSLEYKEPIAIYDRSKEENKWNSIQNVVEDWKNYEPDKTPVDKAFIVRAVAADEEGNISDIVTASYFINLSEYENEVVVSLVADPKELFGDYGIYVTGKEYDDWYLSNGTEGAPIAYFKKTGREVEIDASLEVYFNRKNIEDRESLEAFTAEESFSQDVGIRIQGAGTRGEPKKRFSVYARKEYNESKWFNTTFIENRNVHSVVLRDGFANSVVPYFVKDRSVISQEAFPAVVFLNGEYWYHTYVQEKFSESYFEEKYGIEKDNVIIVKNSMAETLEEDELYSQIYDYAEENDLSKKEVFEQFCDMIDLQSFIDFSCINAYLANIDYDLYKNYIMWRSDKVYDDKYQDGKWRWLIFDMDDVAYQEIDPITNENNWVKTDSFSEQGGGVSYSLNESVLFKALRQNQIFCKQFVLTFMDLVNENFSVEQVEDVLSKWEEDITWNDSFFLKRIDYIVPYLAEEFELTGTLETVELTVNDTDGGQIWLNTITPAMEDGKWSGQYYTDYPVTVTAKANPGYRFVGWSGTVESSEAVLEAEVKEGGIQLNAVFEKTE